MLYFSDHRLRNIIINNILRIVTLNVSGEGRLEFLSYKYSVFHYRLHNNYSYLKICIYTFPTGAEGNNLH